MIGLKRDSVSYDDFLNLVSQELVSEKEKRRNMVMNVAIEGPSNSGKSTLAEQLQIPLGREGLDAIAFEGDRFQVPKPQGMPIYEELIRSIAQGGSVPEDFHERIWRYGDMREQLFDKVRQFNDAHESQEHVLVGKVITPDKMSYAEEGIPIRLTRNSVLVMSGMYLSHLRVFDYFIQLTTDPEIQVQRKVSRDRTRGYERDPKVTRNMVVNVEEPLSKALRAKHPIRRGIIANTDDFEKINARIIR